MRKCQKTFDAQQVTPTKSTISWHESKNNLSSIGLYIWRRTISIWITPKYYTNVVQVDLQAPSPCPTPLFK